MKLTRVLVLCHGNINRSPLFAEVLRKVGYIHVRSRGFGPSGVRTPSRLRHWVSLYGLNLDDHRSITVSAEDILWAEKIVYMDSGNLKRLRALAPDLDKELVCAGSFIRKRTLRDPHFITVDRPDLYAQTIAEVFTAATIAAKAL